MKLPWQASVSHLLQEIERRTGVPPHCQRVIYDGRALNGSPNDADTELGALGLRNPAKVRSHCVFSAFAMGLTVSFGFYQALPALIDSYWVLPRFT